MSRWRPEAVARLGGLWDAVVEGVFEMVLSPSTLDELKDVLNRPVTRRKLVDLDADEVEALVRDLRASAVMTRGQYRQLDIVRADPDDNHVVACALEGLADYVVTVDRNLLLIHRRYVAGHRRVGFLSPAAFLKVLKAGSGAE